MKRLRPVGLLFSVVLWLLASSPCPGDEAGEARKGIVELYKSGKLFDKAQYRAVRAAFAQLFEEKYREVIKKAYGADHEKLAAWFTVRPDIKEDFYTALDDRHDKVDTALTLFKDIWKAFPEQVDPFSNVAIAVAVTWDDESTAVYDYSGHQRRTHSLMPDDLVDGLGNFRYVVEEENAFEGRARCLPWEFLVFVVDHRTPLSERKWAQTYYQSSKGRVKSIHQDVPYDHDMLKGEMSKNSSLKPKLEGLDYTLQNLKKDGGVCAMQADFAARVGKSVCAPSVYCGGESSYRGSHAWTLYVSIQHATKEKLVFSLVSDGRFVGFVKDAFYTGHVKDPKSGEKILDRDMERRLWVAGNDRVGKRQSDLIMRAYPWLCRELGLDTTARMAYLDRCLKVSAYNEAAWLGFAQMAGAGELDASQKQQVQAQLTAMNKTFADYPDFIWKVFDDLLKVQSDGKERVKLYEAVVAVFEKHGRPDLACDARLKIADELAGQEKWPTAAQGLATTIRKFPTEGRYIPKLTLKLQEICKNYKGGNDALARLYLELVPAMVIYYEGDTSEYYSKMYDQALAFLQDNKMDKAAADLKQATDQARALTGKKK